MGPSIEQRIEELREYLNSNSSSNEDPRIKAIINTKLEEAELWASKLIKED